MSAVTTNMHFILMACFCIGWSVGSHFSDLQVIDLPQNGWRSHVTTLTPRCPKSEGGSLALVFASNAVGWANVRAWPQSEDATNESVDEDITDKSIVPAACQLTLDLTLHTTQNGTLHIPIDESGICGRRQTVTAEQLTGRNRVHAIWDVTVQLVVQEEAVERWFEDVLQISCEWLVSPLPHYLDIPPWTERTGQVEVVNTLPLNVSLPFIITRHAEIRQGKWIFEVKPLREIELNGQDFKLVECIAFVPSLVPGAPRLSVTLISNSCVRDRATYVDTTDPFSHIISVAVFKFTDNPTASVRLQCKVALCQTPTGAPSNCQDVTPYGTPCPTVEKNATPISLFYAAPAETS